MSARMLLDAFRDFQEFVPVSLHVLERPECRLEGTTEGGLARVVDPDGR